MFCRTDLQHLCCKALINIVTSIWFHLGYFEIISHSLEFLWIHIHEIEHPGCLADSCKCLSINRMAAGLRLPRSFQLWIFLFSPPFQTQRISTGCRTGCPTDLQHLCCKALIKIYVPLCVGSSKAPPVP